MKNKITYKDLNWDLKVAYVSAWIIGIIYALVFIVGLIQGITGVY